MMSVPLKPERGTAPGWAERTCRPPGGGTRGVLVGFAAGNACASKEQCAARRTEAGFGGAAEGSRRRQAPHSEFRVPTSSRAQPTASRNGSRKRRKEVTREPLV